MIDFPGRPNLAAPVPVDSAGTFRVRVTGCVEHLESAQATIISLDELGDGGPMERTVVLLESATPTATCFAGMLAGEVGLPATGDHSTLDVSLLGERVLISAPLDAPAVSVGAIVAITFEPAEIPTGGGIVEIVLTMSADTPDGATFALRTVPPLPISTAAPRASSRAARVAMSVPHDVDGVWVEARSPNSTSAMAIVRTLP